MDFQLTEEQTMIQDMARQFSDTELAPHSSKWDEEKFLDRDVFKKAAELGFCGIYTGEEHGGTALSRLDSAIVFEQLARGDVSHTAMMTIHNMATWMIDRYGSDGLRAKYVPKLTAGELIASYCLTEPGAGSDAASIKTKAVKDGDDYILNGTKTFISGAGWSNIYVVMARTSDDGARGVSTFVVEKGMDGLSFGANEKKMGWNAQPTAEVIMEDCRIPAENRVGAEGEGFKFAMSGLDGGRINIGCCSLGGAQKAMDATVDYTKERKQFGKPICEFQGIQWKVADMATQIHAARLMIYRAATNLVDGFPDPLEAAYAKLYANEMVQRVTNEALQIHGHYGFTREFPLERMVRDSRGFSLGGGTTEILRNTIAAMVYGRAFDQRAGS